MVQFDSNIFLQGAAMRDAKKQRMFDALSGMLKDKEASNKRDIKASQDPAFIRQQQLLGMPVTPEQMAIQQQNEEEKMRQMGVDARGNVYQKFAPLGGTAKLQQGLMGGQSGDVSPTTQTVSSAIGFDDVAAGEQPYGDVLPPVHDSPMADPNQVSFPEGLSPFAIEDMKKEQFKQDLDMRGEENKRKRDIQIAEPVVVEAMRAIDLETGDMNNAIDRAIDQTTKYSAGKGSLLSFLPESPASDLGETLKTITADSAFTTLTELKDRGGTLGAISSSELELLKSLKSALGQKQSHQQLKFNLNKYKKQRQRSLDKVKREYERVYGKSAESQLISDGNNLKGYSTKELEAMLNNAN